MVMQNVVVIVCEMTHLQCLQVVVGVSITLLHYRLEITEINQAFLFTIPVKLPYLGK